MALAGWGPGPCLWAHRWGEGLICPQGQSGRDAAWIRVCSFGKQGFFWSVSAVTWHSLVSCIGSVLSPRVQEHQGLLGRYVGNRHEQKELCSHAGQTQQKSKLLSPPNALQPQGCPFSSCKELHLPGLGMKRHRNGPRGQPKSRFQVPFPTWDMREIKYPM